MKKMQWKIKKIESINLYEETAIIAHCTSHQNNYWRQCDT